MGLDFELILHETRFESLFGFIFHFFHTENSDEPNNEYAIITTG